jgi:hypothetical protein
MNIKKLVTVSLIVFGLSVVGLLLYRWFNRKSFDTPATVTTETPTFTPTVTVPLPSFINKSNGTTPTPTAGGTTLNMTEIAKHASSSDCWILIGGNVYNVTSYLDSHPGGKARILRYCGQDATTGFQTQDSVPAKVHSAVAQTLLKKYLLGALNQTIN